ncbi:unnamed protein product [Rodentolepis nana]|uniref:FABD domain-containing protein n=1 Tax=Rodentolepis nana TaxID=102285 RepID=A0A0R3TVB2_RODNA|nr:unnamed protein product [Rodentolepis nana]
MGRWEWDSEKRPSFQVVYTRLETLRTSSDINEAVEHELQRHRIRMPPPPLPPPPSTASTAVQPPIAPRRSSSCDRIDETSVTNTDEIPRRAHGNSFTTHDMVPRRAPAIPNPHSQCPPGGVHQQCPAYPSSRPKPSSMVPGNRFSEVFSPSTSMFPPPPPPPPPEFDGSVLVDSGAVGTMSGSLGRRKAAPPAPPQRTTTLKGDDPNEWPHGPIQISIDDCHSFSRLNEEILPSPPDALLANTTLSQSPASPSVSMVSSATFVSTPQSANPHRAAIPVPPQRSESTKNQNAAAQVQEGCIAKSSPKPIIPSAPSSLNGMTSSGSLDFHAELSSRLKRQLDSSRLAETPTRSPPTPIANAVTAEMIKASKSKLKATSTPVAETQPTTQPAVPAWKELVVQRRLKNATETPVGKRMSWAPTSNSSFKQHQPTKAANVEAVSEVAEEEEEKGHEDSEIPAIMSQSMIFPSNPTAVNQTLNYDALLKQIVNLCADLNLATVNLPNEHNNTLIDRIEGLKKACLGYADELDCSAHAKFRFRDDCAKLQKAADTLRSVCGMGGGKQSAASEFGGRRKAFQSVNSTLEAIHQSLLRLGPAVSTSSNDSLEEPTNGTTSRNGFVSTGVA